MMETGAGGSGFLVASVFTSTNWPCGFCTAAADGERRKLDRASRNRKAATLAIESLAAETLAAESLAVEDWDKDILQRRNLFLFYCATTVTWAASYFRPSGYGLPDMGVGVVGTLI